MNRRTAGAATLTVVAIALAALIWHRLPTTLEIYAPFDVHAAFSTRAAGENLSATVTGVSVAPTIQNRPTSRPAAAAGTWLVATTSLDANESPVVPRADLLVGPNTYAPTDRLLSTNAVVQPGLTLRCAWVFDVPVDLLKSVPSVVLRVWNGDDRLNSRLVMDIPLDGAQRLPSIAIPPAETVAP